MSPTTAGRALHRLAERGYVARETVAVTEGEVRDVPVWSVRWTDPAWLRVAATVGQVVLPAAHEPRRRRPPAPRPDDGGRPGAWRTCSGTRTSAPWTWSGMRCCSPPRPDEPTR